MKYPDTFKARMQRLLGSDFDDFLEALQQTPPISVRLNPAKTAAQPNLSQVPWADNGYYLPERPSFTLDPLLHAGTYYVQEASSMFLEQALKQVVDLEKPQHVLDLCGAPGGKSTHLASLISPESLQVSNEVIKSRAYILAENVAKWGSGNVLVTSNDPRDFGRRLAHFFDVMVVDAPCSGEGMFRKDPQAVGEWSEDNVNLCAQRQQRILTDVWEALKPGGILIYSTCTWNEQENEENMAWLAKQEQAETLKLTLQPEWGVMPTQFKGVEGYRFYPHRAQGEGFFMAVVRKAGEAEEETIGKKKKHKLTLAGKKEQALVQDWLINPQTYAWLQHGEVISALPAHLFDAADKVFQNLYVIYAGTEIAEVNGKKLKPLQGLALSQHLNKGAFETAELDLEQALRYLRKEDISLGTSGNEWLLLQFKNIPLGWAKQVGNRMNNYYPKEWRIRMELPQELPSFSLLRI